MADTTQLVWFLAAALTIAVLPGPGLFYVAARTLAGGRAAGIASSCGTGLGGLVQVAAGAAGVAALLLASAQAFALCKLAGAAYLVWLGIATVRAARREARLPASVATVPPVGVRRAFTDGVLVEALNPKTAAFFLALLPQFVDPAASWPGWAQFLILGLISVTLNTAADIAVSCIAGGLQARLVRHPLMLRRLREASGITLCALGGALALARRPAS
jgi:threonine/homoserine/homoserine lactone efflux protein